MKIGIIGVGFVGGATAEVFKGVHELFLYDKYREPYNSQEDLDKLAKHSEVVFICVPTPMQASGAIDYGAIDNSLNALMHSAKLFGRKADDIVVVIRSTAVSGTSDSFASKYPFKFAVNPEFLKEKTALEDMKSTNRIVIGADDSNTAEKVKAVYTALFPSAHYTITDRKTAEMIKYAANTFLASQVMIANELYSICNAVGVDYNKVKEAILKDDRIARNIDVPGPDGDFGFGGKCFPKDLNALIYLSRENFHRPYLFEEVWRANLAVRKNFDWLKIAGATSENKNFKKN